LSGRVLHISRKCRFLVIAYESFGKKKMGCPFALGYRQTYIREQVEYFVKSFKKADMDVDFIFADWEIDGPIEFNEAHAASKRCRRCRENIKNIDNFEEFQRVLRKIRCRLQRETYAEEPAKEIQLVHQVYSQTQQYGDFISNGEPINFDVPRQPGAWQIVF